MHTRSIAAVVALVALGACGGGDKSTGPSGTIAGTYSLKTVNGAALPAVVVQIGADKLEVTSGSVTMNSDNTFNGVTAFRETSSGVVDESSAVCSGTYSRSGSNVTFTETETEDCGGSYPGTWSNGNTLTVTFAPGIQAVFRK